MNNPTSKFIARSFALASVGIEMAVPPFIGLMLDNWLNATPIFLTSFAFLGLAGGLYHIVVITTQMDKEDKNE